MAREQILELVVSIPKETHMRILVIALLFQIAAISAQASQVDVTKQVTKFRCWLVDGDGENSYFELKNDDQKTLEVRYMKSLIGDEIVQQPIEKIIYDKSTGNFELTLKDDAGSAEIRLDDTNIQGNPRGTVRLGENFTREAFNCAIEGIWSKASGL
jgi:hypothetical protein